MLSQIIRTAQALVSHQKPVEADAIIWLQGDRLDRATKVLSLYKKGFSSTIVLSGNNILVGEGKREGEKNITLLEMIDFLKQGGVGAPSIFVDDTAMHTRGQAVNTISLAKRLGWQTLLLVGSTHHQLRAYLTFIKRANEVGWNGCVVNQPAYIPWDSTPSGCDTTAKEIFHQEINKIEKYKDHNASMKEGVVSMLEPLMFRTAILERDAERLFEWRNNPQTYKHFFKPEPVSWKNHLEWLKKTIKNPCSFLYIIYEENVAIGQLRFDIKEDVAEVSVTISPSVRKRGYGTRSVYWGICYFLEKNFTVSSIVAFVKEGNTSSKKLFHQLGFRLGVKTQEGVQKFIFDR